MSRTLNELNEMIEEMESQLSDYKERMETLVTENDEINTRQREISQEYGTLSGAAQQLQLTLQRMTRLAKKSTTEDYDEEEYYESEPDDGVVDLPVKRNRKIKR